MRIETSSRQLSLFLFNYFYEPCAHEFFFFLCEHVMKTNAGASAMRAADRVEEEENDGE